MTLHAPQLITAARMLYAVWLPADPAAAAALVPDELTAREGAPVFINQYVVDDAAQTSSAARPRGLRRVLADLPGRRARRSRHRGRARRAAGGRTTSTPRPTMIAYALAHGVPGDVRSHGARALGRPPRRDDLGRGRAGADPHDGARRDRHAVHRQRPAALHHARRRRARERALSVRHAGRRDVRGRVGRVPRRVAPRPRAAAGRSADDHVRLLLALDLVLLPGGEGPLGSEAGS